MIAFIELTAVSTKLSPVKVRVGGINTYQEFDASWLSKVKSIISLAGEPGELLYVAETPFQITRAIERATNKGL